MAYENTGYLAFANALSNAGNTFGNAMLEGQKQQKKDKYLMDLAPLAKNLDWNGVAETAFKNGDLETAMSALSKAAEEKKIKEQRALGNEFITPFLGNGVGAGAAPAGVSGGVTPNPNPQPQPMQLPGATSDTSLPRGMRNQNPGNIEDGPFARSQPGYVGNDGRFAKFDTMEHGVGAQASLLGSYANKGINTISGIINRYAPQAENGKATQNYAAFVARKIGVDPNAPIDLSDPAMRQKVALVMSEFENGRPVLGAPVPQGVKIADASGAVPASAMPQQPNQPQAASPVDGLMAKKNNLMQAIVRARAQGVDEKTVSSLQMMLDDTQKQIDRADKQTTQQKPDVKQFGDTIYKVGPDGSLTPVQKVEKSAQEKALTEGQSNAALFSDRMINAEKVISDPALSQSTMGLPGTANKYAENLPLGLSGRAQSNEFKRYQRAKSDFISAALRKESGMKIDPSEFDRYDKMWFPQPWDDEQTIKDKAAARQVEIEGMRRGAGPNAGKGEKYSVDPAAVDHLARARQALRDNIPREEVLRTLKSLNIDPSGL